MSNFLSATVIASYTLMAIALVLYLDQRPVPKALLWLIVPIHFALVLIVLAEMKGWM